MDGGLNCHHPAGRRSLTILKAAVARRARAAPSAPTCTAASNERHHNNREEVAAGNVSEHDVTVRCSGGGEEAARSEGM